METADFKILLALEAKWIVSLNGSDFLPLRSADVSVTDSTLQFGKYSRRIVGIEWLRPNVVRIHCRSKFRSKTDTLVFYPGEGLPSPVDLRRRRRGFQREIGSALCSYFGVKGISRQTLYSDRRHGIGGAYPRFIVGKNAVITVDPDETAAVINGIMRAAMLWGPLVRRPVAAVVPRGRHATIAARLRTLDRVRESIRWLQWDGSKIQAFDGFDTQPETHVQEFRMPDSTGEVARIRALAPDLLQAVPHIAGRAVSIRLRGIEVARISDAETVYPLGEPLTDVIAELNEVRRYGSRHPLVRAHEERWLESNLVADIGRLIPSIDARHIYPQVPSFIGEDRNIIDLLTVTTAGRLVVIEIKASPDADLPFQALDYWIAVERHRKARDFQNNGYFSGCNLQDVPALLVLVAPLLAYHKTAKRMLEAFPAQIPLMEIGINQSWKREIKILRRKGMLS